MAVTTYHLASNDSLLNDPGAWWLKASNVFHAWKYTTGYHASVKIGIWDTGIMPHVDLGLPDGASTFPGDNDYVQRITQDSHGSSIWSAIKAIRGNGEGVAGVAPDARVAFFTDTGNGGDATQFAAILDQAAASGIRVVSYSAGPNVFPTGIGGREPVSSDPTTYPDFAAAQAAMQRFVAAGGLLLMAANDADWMEPRDAINVYAYLDRSHALSVSGYSSAENTWGPDTIGTNYTSWGPDIDVVAPAFGCLRPQFQLSGTGTSYVTANWLASGATPLTAGVCALVWSLNPSLTAAQVKEIVKSTARKVSHLGGNFNAKLGQYGAGMVDAGKAVKAALATVPASAGQVFPYLGMSGAGQSITVNTVDGTATTTLNGEVWLDVAGFSSDPITRVELWVGDRRLYRGPPAVLRAASASYTPGGGSAAQITIKAYTANGSAEETYSDVLVNASLEVAEPYHWPTNDALLDYAWQNKRINLYHGWKYGRGGSAVKGIVADDGLAIGPDGYETIAWNSTTPKSPYNAIAHPDLPAPDAAWKTGVDPTCTGSLDPANAETEYPNNYSHGSDVWAHAKGTAGNGVGAAGVAPDNWMAFACTSGGSAPFNQAAAGVFRAAIDRIGAKVINWSGAIPGAYSDPTLRPAIDYFIANGGILVQAISDHQASYYYADGTSAKTGSNSTDAERILDTIEVSGIAGIAPAVYDDPMAFFDTFNGGWEAIGWGPRINIVAPCSDSFAASGPWEDYPVPWPLYAWGGGYLAPDPTTHHPSTSFGAPQVYGAILLGWNQNPSLTSAQIKALLYATADVGRHPDFTTRYPNAGILNVGKFVKACVSTANGGEVVPYFGFSGPNAATTIADGAARTVLNGEVFLDVTGFVNGAEVPAVELWTGTTKVYEGPPMRLTAAATYNGTTSVPIKVVAKTAGGSASEAYSDVLVTSLAVQGGTSISVATRIGFVPSANDAWVVARNAALGRSYLAGPYEFLDSSYDRHDHRVRFGHASASSFAAAWSEAESIAAACGFSSLSAFVAAWSKAESIAQSFGFSGVSDYALAIRENAAPWNQAFGFESASAFVAAWARFTNLTHAFGFSGVSSFAAMWNDVMSLRPAFSLSFAGQWDAAFPMAFAVSARHGFTGASEFLAAWEENQTFAARTGLSFAAVFWDDMTGGLDLRPAFGLGSSSAYAPPILDRPLLRLNLYDRTARFVLSDRTRSVSLSDRAPRFSLFDRSDDS